jgi:hypothetical protein
MGFCILVARYNENVDWAFFFQNEIQNVIIYNKGTELNNCSNQILLTNVGREGHSYYKYIYENYFNLEDYTIFLQGNPFDHSPNIIKKLYAIINDRDLKIDFEFLSEIILECNLSGCKYHSNIPLKEVYEKIFNEKNENKEFKFGMGAQFIVSKAKILQRPQSFYLNIIELLQHDIDPIEGYVVERFHQMIFE